VSGLAGTLLQARALWFAARPALNWVEMTIGIATGARFLLVAGLSWGKSLQEPNPARFLGALLTYLCGLALVVGLWPKPARATSVAVQNSASLLLRLRHADF
jgi:uncharacterized membrane protein YphA (DoxX/SURF4 family)